MGRSLMGSHDPTFQARPPTLGVGWNAQPRHGSAVLRIDPRCPGDLRGWPCNRRREAGSHVSDVAAWRDDGLRQTHLLGETLTWTYFPNVEIMKALVREALSFAVCPWRCKQHGERYDSRGDLSGCTRFSPP